MDDLREQYEKANALGKLAFAERPCFGSPGAPAQTETNASIRAKVEGLPFIRQQRAKNLAPRHWAGGLARLAAPS